jgi:hypothetical protein
VIVFFIKAKVNEEWPFVKGSGNDPVINKA